MKPVNVFACAWRLFTSAVVVSLQVDIPQLCHLEEPQRISAIQQVSRIRPLAVGFQLGYAIFPLTSPHPPTTPNAA